MAIAGALLLGGVHGGCFEATACRAYKASIWLWLTPLLALVAGTMLGALFLRMTNRRD